MLQTRDATAGRVFIVRKLNQRQYVIIRRLANKHIETNQVVCFFTRSGIYCGLIGQIVTCRGKDADRSCYLHANASTPNKVQSACKIETRVGSCPIYLIEEELDIDRTVNCKTCCGWTPEKNERPKYRFASVSILSSIIAFTELMVSLGRHWSGIRSPDISFTKTVMMLGLGGVDLAADLAFLDGGCPDTQKQFKLSMSNFGRE